MQSTRKARAGEARSTGQSGVSGETPTVVAERRVQSVWTMQAKKAQEYVVTCTRGLLVHGQNSMLPPTVRRALVVVTPTVYDLYWPTLEQFLRNQGCAAEVLKLGLSESNKSMDSLESILRAAAELALGRQDALIAFGGGVCNDVVTVAASMVRRGVPLIKVPTTLVAQIDAAIGVKGALNVHSKKNFVGCYYPPHRVFIDPSFLRSLLKHQVSDGVAEIIKMAIVREPSLFQLLDRHVCELIESRMAGPAEVCDRVISSAIGLMLEQLATNLYENSGYQRRVDAGHTISPDLEAATGFTLSHGSAVAIDLAFSAMLSVEMGLASRDVATNVVVLLKKAHLPTNHEELSIDLIRHSFKSAMLHRGGHLHLPLMTEIGECVFVDRHEISDADVCSALHKLGRLSASSS